MPQATTESPPVTLTVGGPHQKIGHQTTIRMMRALPSPPELNAKPLARLSLQTAWTVIIGNCPDNVQVTGKTRIDTDSSASL